VAKVLDVCRDRIQEAFNAGLKRADSLRDASINGIRHSLDSVPMICQTALARVFRRSELTVSAEGDSKTIVYSEKFSKRPFDKIGFSFAWVCDCGHFAADRSEIQTSEDLQQRECPECGASERLAYVRLLCEPRVGTAGAAGKWVYPEVIVEPREPGGPCGRDYDWSHYDVLYFQDDRDPDVSTCALVKRA